MVKCSRILSANPGYVIVLCGTVDSKVSVWLMKAGLLPGVRVLELGEGVSAPYCGKILAGLGAEVIKVEPPQGDVARSMGPFPGDEPHPEKSGVFLALNANKYGVTLDIDSTEGREAFRRVARTTDVVVESMPKDWMDERGLGYADLSDDSPALVMTSLSPFGTWGPYAGYKLTDLTLFHMSGQAHSLLGPVQDPDSEPPIRAGGTPGGTCGGNVRGNGDADGAIPQAHHRRGLPHRGVGV